MARDGGEVWRHVVLVGLMGVGKTTVGRRLAKELERPFADADEHVELRAGRTVAAIFRSDGEARFRCLEAGVLRDLIATPSPLVIAAGGGAVTQHGNRAELGGCFVVWLRASAEFLSDRTDPTHRPLLGRNPRQAFARLLAERSPLYEMVADAIVDVEPFHDGDDKPKRLLAQHIAELARSAPGTA